MIDKELVQTSHERHTIYSFLKIALEKPLTSETLKNWKVNFTSEFIDILTDGNEELAQFFKDLKSNDLTALERQEKDAYLATFNLLNKTGKIPAPPWESVYVTKDQSMFGDPVFQIRRKLAEFGLQFVDENKEPEDHIAFELEFMCYLINYTIASLEEGNEDEYLKGLYSQYWLHKEHLHHWIQPFTNDIQSSDTSLFYIGISKLLQLFVEEDFEYIKFIKEGLENE